MPPIQSKLPQVGTTIFTVMSSLANEYKAINLGQGFPDYPMNAELVELVNKAMKDGYNQYTHMCGLPALRERIATNPADGVVGALAALAERPDSTPTLPTIDVPTLVLVGAEDGLTPPAVHAEMHAAIAGSRLVVIPAAGHMSPMEAPPAFNAAFGDFLNEIRIETAR